MHLLKYLSPFAALALIACGGDDAQQAANPSNSNKPLTISQALTNQFSGNIINYAATLQSDFIYKDLLSQSWVNGKTEASLSSYEAINIDKGSKQLLSQLLDYDRSTMQWKDRPLSSNATLYLIDGQWRPLTGSSSQSTADGNDVIVDYGNGIKYKISAVEKDISNILPTGIYPTDINNPDFPSYHLFKTPAPAFPAGSKAYYAGSTPLQTTYSSSFSNKTTFKKIEEFISFYASTGKNKKEYNANCQIQFDTSNKRAVFSPYENPEQKCSIPAQPYEIQAIGQQQLLVVTLPPSDLKSSGKSEFYAINKNELLEGDIEQPFNGALPSSNFEIEVLYNKTAINHLLKYGGLPLAAQIK
ncbi:MAG: hypothetical protein NT086_03610 [Proteobacteria bacterium]|nr:hypothetical protein [Pseudomonadota bacterium]